MQAAAPIAGQVVHRWRAYLVHMLGTALVTVMACGAVNLGLDAAGIFGAPGVAGINRIKPYLDHHRELSRWQAARRVCAPAGIFGNSRAEIGFDPEHPGFVALGGAFNHAIPGTSVATSSRQMHWLIEAGCAPHTVVLGLEFFDFLGGTAVDESNALIGAPHIDLAAVAETLLSLSALRDSLATLALQRSAHPAGITERGFNPLLNYTAEVRQSGHHALFKQRATENLKNWSNKPKRLHTSTGDPSSDQVALQVFLQQAGGSATSVHILIYPYHAQIRLMIKRLGLSSLFNEWKSSVVATAKRASTKQLTIQVWDFSGISPQTLELIPAAGDRQTQLQHYWEAGHFKKALGDQMLDQVLGDGHAGFGKALQLSTLDAWLAQDEARVRALANEESPLVLEVNRLFNKH